MDIEHLMMAPAYSGGTQVTVLYAAESWAAHVVRLHEERDLPDDHPSAWSMHDYRFTLGLRDRLLEGLDAASPGPPRAPAIVRATDALFLSFTVPDTLGVVAGIDPEMPMGDQWWWRRVPATGPVAADLSDLWRRRSQREDDEAAP